MVHNKDQEYFQGIIITFAHRFPFLILVTRRIFLCGASKGFIKALKAFIKPFEAPQRSVKTKI